MRARMRLSSLFLPALCVYPVWLAIGVREDVLVPSVSKYYPMMIAMVLGSMIAGSTPLGGGVVAFPVSVLVLGFRPDQGRDFSLMIQSVGMTAASFLIFSKKRLLLKGCEDMLVEFSVLSVIGVIIGLECFFHTSPYIVNVVYSTTVACVTIVLAYFDYVGWQQKTTKDPGTRNDNETRDNIENGDVSNEEVCDETERTNINESFGYGIEMISIDYSSSATSTSTAHGRRWIVIFSEYICLPLFAVFGGILSSQIGTGADIACYFYGCFYNAIKDPCSNGAESQISGNALTAASVIIMANTSIFGSILRFTTRNDASAMVDNEVYQTLMACVPIVVLGAPIGALFLTPSNQERLRYLFYALGVLQLLLFGILKIQNDYMTWSAVMGIISLMSSFLCGHKIVSRRKSQSTK